MLRGVKDHVIPHAGNNYRPHLLQRVAMSIMLGLVMLSFAMANLHAVIWLNVDWLISAVLPAVVVSETNDERSDSAVAPLARNATLDRAAQLKAEHMAELGYFAHYAPDGTSPWHWFNSVNYPFVHAGENLAVHFNDSREVVRAWMDSPTHRANILNGNFTEIGIGIAEGTFEGYETVFVVQMFGSPAQPVVAAEPAAVPEPETVTVVTEQVTEPTPTTQVAAAEETVLEVPIAVPVEQEPEPVYELPVISKPTSTELELVEVSPEDTETELVARETEQFISTTTNAVPAITQAEPSAQATNASLFDYFATSPQLVLQTLYIALGGFVLVILLISLMLEFRRHQFIHAAYSFGLLCVMAGLYALQTIVTTGATIV